MLAAASAAQFDPRAAQSRRRDHDTNGESSALFGAVDRLSACAFERARGRRRPSIAILPLHPDRGLPRFART